MRSADPSQDPQYAIESGLVNRRGIYKDVVGSGSQREFCDYQLRANFPVAMTVAPELFNPEHAITAIRTYIDALWGPLGVATLDPQDSHYRPFYDNANDSEDYAIAKGRKYVCPETLPFSVDHSLFSYHQGPEWGWPGGYLLRAFLHFDMQAGKGKGVSCPHIRLARSFG